MGSRAEEFGRSYSEGGVGGRPCTGVGTNPAQVLPACAQPGAALPRENVALLSVFRRR